MPAWFSIGPAASLLVVSALGVAVAKQVTVDSPSIATTNDSLQVTTEGLPNVENVPAVKLDIPIATPLPIAPTASSKTTLEVVSPSTPIATPATTSTPAPTSVEVIVDGQDKNPSDTPSGTTKTGDTTVTWNNQGNKNQNTTTVTTESQNHSSVSVYSQNSTFSSGSSFNNKTEFSVHTGGQ